VWTVSRVAVAAASLACLGLVLAGCGGGGKAPKVASLGTTSTPTTTSSGSASSGPPNQAQATHDFVKFANCMDRHGVQVQVAQGGRGISINGGPGPDSATMKRAQAACQKLLPGGGPKALTPAQAAQNLKGLLKLAQCMRTHGYPSFPDPNGQGVFNLGASSGFDPNSAQFQSAMNACGKLAGGRLRIGIRAGSPAPSKS
jgi:hypothetical protein